MIKNKNIHILFEDDCLFIVDKPTGLLVIPTPQNEKYTLTSILNEDFVHVYPCHRLDRETSGVIIYAKGKKNQQKIMQQFKERKVRKAYIAFVQGHLKKPEGILRDYIDNKIAVTKYKLLERKRDFDIVEIYPLTGRKNQIRIQFKKIGHPLVGERRFAFARDFKLKFRRAALHAQKIEFFHPKTNKRLVFEANLAQDLVKLRDS